MEEDINEHTSICDLDRWWMKMIVSETGEYGLVCLLIRIACLPLCLPYLLFHRFSFLLLTVLRSGSQFKTFGQYFSFICFFLILPTWGILFMAFFPPDTLRIFRWTMNMIKPLSFLLYIDFPQISAFNPYFCFLFLL